MSKGTQYIQFMPVNGSCNPGPSYGPCEEVQIGSAGFYKNGIDSKDGILHTVCASVNDQVFILKDEIWQLQIGRDGKNTFEPIVDPQGSYVPANAPAGSKPGYSWFRIISLQQMILGVKERLRRETEFAATLKKTLALEDANEATLQKIHSKRDKKKATAA